MFSTAGRSEVLPANSVPEDTLRAVCQDVCVFCCYMFACACVCLYSMHLSIQGCVYNGGECCSECCDHSLSLVKDDLIVSYILLLHILHEEAAVRAAIRAHLHY